MILFIALPMLVALSLVAEIITAIIVVVFSNDAPTDAADEAVFDIAIASSSVEDAEEAANVE